MLTTQDHIHFIGIGGTGISAIARVLLERGVPVSGSDRQPSPLAEALKAAGVRVAIGHAAENVAGATLVVRSSAVQDDNVEVQEARRLGIPVLKRADFLGRLMVGQAGIAVAGTHGKTTTTGMIAWMLTDQGREPSFIVGGVLGNLGANARAGRGAHFVIEADEYDRMFLGLRPEIAVVTNVEHDHPDLFPGEQDFTAAFDAFVDLLPPSGTLIAWGDSDQPRRLAARAQAAGRQALTYGESPANDFRLVRLEARAGAGFAFDLLSGGQRLGRIALQVPGAHNALNASAAAAVGLQVGLPYSAVAESLGRFTGVGRRFEVRGEAGGVVVVDDYAHHPTEIRATIAAARARYPDRALWVVWQPHTFSRVAQFEGGFAGAFGGADHVIVTGVYAAREAPPPGFRLDRLVAAMGHPDARLVERLEEVSAVLRAGLGPNSVLLVLSAGDADRVSAEVYQALGGAPDLLVTGADA